MTRISVNHNIFRYESEWCMKNIFVEGIQGAGKTTLTNHISRLRPKLRVCREGDYNPVELAWCALMGEAQYREILEKYSSLKEEIIKNTIKERENYIVTYTKIETDISGFYKEMECYEVYNGRKSLSELKSTILARYKNFTESGYVFECSFFQNVIEDLILFHMLSDEEIVMFYRDLFEVINQEKFMMLYLYSDKLEKGIQRVRKERCDANGNEIWYQMLLEYIQQSPYGRKHGCSEFEDLIKHLKHRQELELAIIREVIGEKAIVLPAKEYVLLDDFLYEAIFILEGVEAPPREIISAPELQVYVQDFGKREGDLCLVAEIEEGIVGAVWARIMNDYGHIEEGVPSLAISLYKNYRGQGIGTAMMKQMLTELKIRGYQKTSLAVQKENYAVKMYKNVGFEIVDENEEEYIMVCAL